MPLTKLQSEALRVPARERSPDSYIAGGVALNRGRREAEVEGFGDRMALEWVADSAFRFFPAQRDELFGYVLHPVDLATNKASAAVNPATSSTW